MGEFEKAITPLANEMLVLFQLSFDYPFNN